MKVDPPAVPGWVSEIHQAVWRIYERAPHALAPPLAVDPLELWGQLNWLAEKCRPRGGAELGLLPSLIDLLLPAEDPRLPPEGFFSRRLRLLQARVDAWSAIPQGPSRWEFVERWNARVALRQAQGLAGPTEAFEIYTFGF